MFENLVLRTPLIPYLSSDSDLTGRIYLKPESLQAFGSYKIRGVISAINSADSNLLKNGLYAASAGNMAQSVAYAAQILKVPCKIFLPTSAPHIKKQAIAKLGAEIVELPFEQVWEMVKSPPKISGLFFHPVFTQGLLKGYSEISREIIEDLPDVDTVVVPFGVGGLTLGLLQNLTTGIIPCEPVTSSPLNSSLKQGRPVPFARIPSFIDAIGTPEVLPEVFDRVSHYVKSSLVVGLDETKDAMNQLFQKHKLVSEGAGGAALAGAIQLAKTHRHSKIVAIISGGNAPTELLREFL